MGYPGSCPSGAEVSVLLHPCRLSSVTGVPQSSLAVWGSFPHWLWRSVGLSEPWYFSRAFAEVFLLCETRFACLSRRQWASVLTVPKHGVSFRQWCLILLWLRVVPFFPLSKCNSVFCWFLPEMGIFIHSFPTQSNGQLFLLCLLLSYLTAISPGLCCRHSRARSRDRLGEVQKK